MELVLEDLRLLEVVIQIAHFELSLVTLDDLDEVYHLMVSQARPHASALGRKKPLSSTSSELCPHFGVVWPSSLALAQRVARYVAEMPKDALSSSHPFLELGAGLAIPALTFAKLTGRPALATDRHPLAGQMMKVNAARNQIQTLMFELLDFRTATKGRKWPLIVGSEILYEAWQPGYLAHFLAHALTDDGVSFIADPERKHLSLFKDCALAHGLKFDQESAIVKGTPVTILRISRNCRNCTT